MKIIYTILFFADTSFLFLLARLFLKLLDKGMDRTTFVLILAAILLSIVLLVYFLIKFIKLPVDEGKKDFLN